jgi:WD40 repeat protein
MYANGYDHYGGGAGGGDGLARGRRSAAGMGTGMGMDMGIGMGVVVPPSPGPMGRRRASSTLTRSVSGRKGNGVQFETFPEEHVGGVSCLVGSGGWVATGGYDTKVRLWNYATGGASVVALPPLTSHSNVVSAVGITTQAVGSASGGAGGFSGSGAGDGHGFNSSYDGGSFVSIHDHGLGADGYHHPHHSHGHRGHGHGGHGCGGGGGSGGGGGGGRGESEVVTVVSGARDSTLHCSSHSIGAESQSRFRCVSASTIDPVI